MDKQIGLRLTVDARDVSSSAKQLAEFEKRLDEVRKALQENKKEAGSTQEYARLREEQLKLQGAANEVRKEMRQQEKAFKDAKFPSDSIIGLRKRYRELKHEIDGLSSADPEFKKKALEAEQLSNRINELNKSAGSYKDNIGRYAQDIGGLFGNFGALAGGLAAGGGLAAAFEILREGTQIVSDLTQEMVTLRGQIKQLTGATGAELDGFATKLSATAQTFGKDTSELLTAANALSKAYDIDLGEALDRLNVGFLAGADSQGEFLDKVKEYPAQLKNAGFSVDEFIKLATQEVKEGIYSDKLIDTLKEADLSLKEFTKTQRDALQVLGPEFADQLEKDIKSGEVTVKDAIFRIAEQAKKSGADLQQVQTITADVFKGAGEDAGGFQKITEVVFRALEQDYESLIDTENELVIQQQKLLEINERFAAAQVDLAKELGAVDGNLKTVGAQIKTGLLEGLVGVIRYFKDLFGILQPVGEAFGRLFRTLGLVSSEGRATEGVVKALGKAYEIAQIPLKLFVASIVATVDRWNQFAGAVRGFLERLGIIEKAQADSSQAQKKAMSDIEKSQAGVQEETQKTESAYKSLNKEVKQASKELAQQGKVAEKLSETSLAYLQKRVQELKTELSKAPSDEAFAAISAQITEAETRLERATAAFERFRDAQLGISSSLAALPAALPEGAQEGEDDNARLQRVIAALDIENKAKIELEEETAGIIKEIRQNTADFTAELRQQEKDELLAQQAAINEQSEAIQREFEQSVVESLAGFLTDSDVKFKDFLKSILTSQITALEKALIAEGAARSLVGNLIAGPAGFAKGLAESAIVTGIIKGLFAAARAAVQSFQQGGQVIPIEQFFGVNAPNLRSGVIRARPNIASRPGGDNVLATVKVGEVILNEQQQRRLRQLAGHDIFKAIGVPGFQAGGFVTPQLVNPSRFVAQVLPSAPAVIDPESIRQQAAAIGEEVGTKVEQSVRKGITEANERSERIKALEKNIGL